LNTWYWEILPHSPYSLDLAPSDFHLIPNWRSTFEVCAIKLMKTTKRRSGDGCVCRTRHFNIKALDSLMNRYDKYLKRYGYYVEKQTTYVPICNPCVTYCNLFIFQIKNRELYVLTSPCNIIGLC
jgi:hypothetical protein